MSFRKSSMPGFVMLILIAVSPFGYQKYSGTFQKSCHAFYPAWNHCFGRRCLTDRQLCEFPCGYQITMTSAQFYRKVLQRILIKTRAEKPEGDTCESWPRSPCRTLQGALPLLGQRQERNVEKVKTAGKQNRECEPGRDREPAESLPCRPPL